MSEPRPVHVLALVSEPGLGAAVVRHAATLSGACQAKLTVVCAGLADYPPLPAGSFGLICEAGAPGEVRARAQRFAAQADVGMVVCGWDPDVGELEAAMRMALELRVPAVLVRDAGASSIGRILVPTTGGPHVVKQLWVADVLARALQAPTQVLQVVARHDAEAEAARGRDACQGARARLAGLVQPMDVVVAEDAVRGIAGYARAGDLIVLGAPNYWRVLHQFGGSIPDLVARAVPNPLLMLLTPRASHLRLGDIFWPEMVRLDMAPRDAREALGMLVEVLVQHGQLPPQYGPAVLEQALAREGLLSTAVDCETALPHVTLADFAGMIGAFGICPQGLAFGGREARAQPTRFFFLLITPTRAYGEYLNVLAMIARLVLPVERRARLLACRSAAEVAAILAEASPAREAPAVRP